MNLIGKVLGNRYEIIEVIGSGGMAIVYKARCRLLNRFVAVKVLREDLKDNQEFINRFNVESQSAASLSHNNIVSIYDVGNEDGIHYIVMEYVEGDTLKEYIERNGKLPWREAVENAIQICSALLVAHKNFIVHRDIKPHNIIRTKDGILKVTDFGIARANNGATMTIAGSTIGSVHYLSPEQARGGYTDEKTDLYSLGIVLYEMCTGKVPFESDSAVSVAIKHIQEKPVPPREYNMTIPRALENIILKAITKEQSNRYAQATDMLKDLEKILQNPDVRISGVISDGMPPQEQTAKMPSVTDEKINENNNKVRAGAGFDADRDAEIEKFFNDEDAGNMGTNNKNRSGRVAVGLNRSRRPARKQETSEEYKNKEKIAVIAAIITSLLLIGLITVALMYIGGINWASNEIEVPPLVGKKFDEVREQYKNSKFNIIEKQKVENNEYDEGYIVAQSPDVGKKVKDKQQIDIEVEISKGKKEMTLSDYTKNQDYRAAKIEIEAMGLKVEEVPQSSDVIPIDVVISQAPGVGSKVKVGDTVKLYISSGPSGEAPSPSPGAGSTPAPSSAPTAPPATQPPANVPEPVEKSKIITLQSPSNGKITRVMVKANGKTIHDQDHSSGESFDIKIKGTTDSAKVEVYNDGVLRQTQTVKLE